MSTKLANVGLAVRKAFGPLLAEHNQFGQEAAEQIARAAGEEVLAKAVELSPFRTGFLEGSGRLVVHKGRATVEFDAPYASEAHERPENAVGPGTQAKAGNELGPAGPKYLERPMVAMQEALKQIAAEEMQRKLTEEL